MRLLLSTLTLTAVLALAACDGDNGAMGAQGPAGPTGPAGPGGPSGPAGPAGQTDFETFVRSSLNDPQFLAPRDVNGLDFTVREDPDQFDDVF